MQNRRGKELHEVELQKYIEEGIAQGIKIIDLAGKSPDAIQVEVIDGRIKVIAVEVLPARWNRGKNAWVHSWTYKQKQECYSMFDAVNIIEYRQK